MASEAAKARKRARRKAAKAAEVQDAKELELLYNKPIEDWDLEELAAGRPRDANGFLPAGPKPSFIPHAVHEEAMERFRDVIRGKMRYSSLRAVEVIQEIMEDSQVDERGRPLVTAGDKLRAAQFLLEHYLGKPKQQIEADVSVKLQSMLGEVLVQPSGKGTRGNLELVMGPSHNGKEAAMDVEWYEDDDEDE